MSPVGHPQALGSHTYRKLLSVSLYPSSPTLWHPLSAVTAHLVPEAETWIFFIPSPALPKLSRLPDLIYFLSVPQIHSPLSPNYCWLVLSLLLVTNLNLKFFLRNLLSLFFQVIVCSWLCHTDSQKNPWVTSFPMYASGMKKLVLGTVTELFAHGVPAANRVPGFGVLI